MELRLREVGRSVLPKLASPQKIKDKKGKFFYPAPQSVIDL